MRRSMRPLYVGGMMILGEQGAEADREKSWLRLSFALGLMVRRFWNKGIIKPKGGSEAEIKHLPRVILDFVRRNFGGLKSFVDAVNQG